MASTDGICSLCDQLGEIVGGKAQCEEETCSVTIPRTGIDAAIQGREVRSDEVLGIGLTFASLDAQGDALCLGEATLLEHEVSDFVATLSRQGIRLTAIHNHWLADQPRLIYVHFQAVMNPLRFARGLAPVLRRLKSEFSVR